MDGNILLNNIIKLGDLYCDGEEFLGQWKGKDLENDWWEALKFFLNHSFMKGRRDSLSLDYYYFTCEVIEEKYGIKEDKEAAYSKIREDSINGYFNYEKIVKGFKKEKKLDLRNNILLNTNDKENNNKGKKSDIEKQKLKIEINDEFKKKYKDYTIIKELTKDRKIKDPSRIGKHRRDGFEYSLENDKDLCMVLDVLKFISREGRQYVYAYLLELIEVDKGIKNAYKEIDKIKEIGDKLASFIIRDILLLNGNSKLNNEEYIYAFPIDTWVLKVAEKMDLLKSEEIQKIIYNKGIKRSLNEIKSSDIKKIKLELLEKSKEHNSLKFAAGLWLLGTNSLELLIENYLKKEISEDKYVRS